MYIQNYLYWESIGFAYICISEGVLAVWSHTKKTSRTDGGFLIILSLNGTYGVGGSCHTFVIHIFLATTEALHWV